jgi:hypothetical protein
VTDGERVIEVDEDPIGAMRLVSTAPFGQRALALSAVAVGERTEPGLFDSPAALSWPWPDWTTCTFTKHVVDQLRDGPAHFA